MPTAIPPHARDKPRILIVEDEALVAADIEERLRRMGYQVCGQADTFDGAVSEAALLCPDLVLMDIHLIGPRDGVEAATEIRRINETPVVFLTAHADDATLARMALAEPFGYAVKPFDERELKATIEVALYRHQAETRLKKMERWLSTTLGSIGDGVIATDLHGKVKFINPVAEAMTGWFRHRALGVPAGEVIRLEKEGKEVSLTALLDQAYHLGAAIFLGEGHFLRRKDGGVMPVGDSISVIRNDDGTISGWVIILRDLSALHEAEAGRKRLEEKMREAQRLESLGVLAGGIAHDFNNLLQIVVSSASLAQAMLKEGDAEAAVKLPLLLDEIRASADRGGKLCGQMLAYAGQGRFQVRDLDLTGFTRETVNLLQASVSKNANLVLKLNEKLPVIRADASQIQQIVMNLVLNASDALEGERGSIKVETDLVALDEAELAECKFGDELSAGDYVSLKVTDTGRGMAAETMARIFEPFYTTKFMGRGLGLAAVTGIVRTHGGALRVTSELGKGSCFQIFFPAAKPVDQPVQKPASAPERWKSFGRVLLVDDEPEILAAAAAILKHLGFDVDTAEDGRTAVDKVLACQGNYRFVLMDLTMPVLSGQEALAEMRARHPGLPVVIMSGYSDDADGGLFDGERPSAFIQKPFPIEDLIQTLRGLLK